MPLTVQPAFGSFVYDSNSADIEEWRDEGAVRAAVTPVPRSHVARAIDGFLGPRRVSVRGIIGPDGGGTRDQLRTATDAFGYAHRAGFRQLKRDADRYLNAEVRRVTLGADEGLSFVPFAVEFEAADPYWYDTTPASDTWNTPLTAGTRAVANGGSAPAAPVFTITVSATGTLTLTLENTTTGESFTVSGLAVTNGQALVVDCAAQTVKLAGSNAMSYFTGSFWLLEPGSNTLTLTLSGVTLTSIGTAFTPRYL